MISSCQLALLAAAVSLAAVDASSSTAHAATFTPGRVSVTLGAAYADFTQQDVRALATASGAWSARLTLNARWYLGFEANYLGTAGAEKDPVGPDPLLATTQLTGGARFNLIRGRVQPFVTTGVGWINLHSSGREGAPIAARNFSHDDNGVVVPVGGGLAGYIGNHTVIDVRVTYNFVTGARDFSNTNDRPDMWVGQINAGYVF